CCVYVGDAPQDVEMARSAGVLAIGAIGPFPTEKRLRGARLEFLLGSLEELPKVLERVRNGVKYLLVFSFQVLGLSRPLLFRPQPARSRSLTPASGAQEARCARD